MSNVTRSLMTVTLMTLALTAGCTPFADNNLIEDISPVILWSMEEGKEGKLQVSTIVPPLIKEKKRLLTLQVDLMKQAGKEFNLIYYRELKPGQLRIVFISEELAKKGIVTLISTLLTDPDISQRLYVVIVKGSVEDYITSQLSKQDNIDYFLYRMLKHYERNNQGEMSIINLHQFKNMLYTPLWDPFLPVFQVNKDKFIYEGTAFFHDDKMETSIKGIEDQIYQLINDDHYLNHFTIPDLSTTIGHAEAKVFYHLDPAFSSLSVKVTLEGRIEEYRGDKDIHDGDTVESLNQELKSYMEEHTTKLFTKLKQRKVDPLKIGRRTLHPFKKPMSEEEWRRLWESMKISVHYELKLEPMAKVK